MRPRTSDFAIAVSLTLLALAAWAGPARAEPQRIVAVGGDVTEILYALGAGDRIIAVDSTSQYPPSALETHKNVGYMRALSAEGVLSVGGTHIIASESAGPAEAIRALQASRLAFVTVPDAPTPEGIAEKVRVIAGVIGAEAKGAELAGRILADFKALEERRKRIARRIDTLFVLATTGERVLVGGEGTSAAAILEAAGAANAAAGVTGYKPVSVEALVAMAPAAIVVMERRGTAHSAEALLEMAAVRESPAGRSGRIFAMDGLYLLGFGPRTPAAAADLMAKLHPETTETR